MIADPLSELTSFLNKAYINLQSKAGELAQKISFESGLFDHACYRTQTLEDYNLAKEYFSQHGSLLIESPINGRPIATYKLHKTFGPPSHPLDVVEVPAPKANAPTLNGWEHVEWVYSKKLNSLAEDSPALNWKFPQSYSSLNPEAALSFEGMNYKFHNLPLESIIVIEKFFEAHDLKNFLEYFSEHTLLFSGSKLIGVDLENSDLDVLAYVKDFEAFQAKVAAFTKSFSNFQILDCYKNKTNPASFVIQLKYKEKKVELFAQSVPVLEQNSHRHLLVEYRLLKLKGELFKKEVIDLKEEGLNTEAAFARALKIQGNEFEELLKLECKTNLELLAI